MAWGSWFKKVKDFGNKLVGGARQAIDWVKTKGLPIAKEIGKVVTPFVPGGGLIQKGLEYADDVVNVADEYTSKAEEIRDKFRGGNLKVSRR